MKTGVILSGCGVFDGSEIHEAVLTMLCLEQHGATYQCMAPDKQFPVIDHMTQKPATAKPGAPGEMRRVLVEAARIARGDILDLAKVKGADYDAFILPGGYGAAINLSTYAADGPTCQADPQVARVLQEAHAAGKPLGFVCLSPVIAAKVFGPTLHPLLTIGHDSTTSAAMEKMGARHRPCAVRDCIVDECNRIVSTPAYMEAKTMTDVYEGVDKLVAALVTMARQGKIAASVTR